jgi:iron-sulfur cluster assembly protein
MAISLTAAAADYIRGNMEKEGFSPADDYLRIGVRGGGCSGMSYKMEFEKAPGEADMVHESQGLRILVDRKSYLFVNRTEIDYGGTSVLNRSFKFNNPNVAQACGCGTSFSVE